MLQDIAPHKLINTYDPGIRSDKDDSVFIFKGRDVLIRQGDGELLPRLKDFKEAGPCRYLLKLDDKPDFFMHEPEELPEGFIFKSIRDLRKEGNLSRELMFLLITASQLCAWYEDNRYCGRCGSKTKHSETERALICPSCGRIIYPRIVPAVIVGVTDGDKILVTKYRGRGIDYYALIAGFTEIGETLEETVAREVMEEAGLKVKNITYYKSQPWGIVDDILAGFYCEVDGDNTIHADMNELKEAKWVTRQEIVLQPDDFSLTNEMMLKFKEGARVI